MKKFSLTVLAVAALGTPAFAADIPVKAAPLEISGHVAIYGGWADSEWWDTGVNVFGGEGRVNYWWGPGISIQTDVETEFTTFYNTGDNGRFHGAIGTHVTWRDRNSFAYGVFASIVGANEAGHRATNVFSVVGGEAQYYSGPFTAYVQGGFINNFDAPSIFSVDNASFVRVVGRYFFSPNDKIQAEGSWGWGENGFGDQMNITAWGVSYQHKFDHMPISVGVEYAAWSMENTFCGNIAREHMFLGKITYHLGEKTLLHADRNGATLDQPRGVYRALTHGSDVSCL